MSSSTQLFRAEPGRPGLVGAVLLVADPDGLSGAGVDAAFHRSGWETVVCRDGAEALVEFGRCRPDAVLTALRLAHVDTPTVVRTMRNAGSQPILVGIGPGDLEEVGPSLVAGATGAVARPYVAADVVTRLAAEIGDIEERVKLVYGPLELDPRAYRVRVAGVALDDLPLKEFELLRLLMSHADLVVSAELIRDCLWRDKPGRPSSNAVTVHVGRLRARLAGVAELHTVRGRGYRLTVATGS